MGGDGDSVDVVSNVAIENASHSQSLDILEAAREGDYRDVLSFVLKYYNSSRSAKLPSGKGFIK